MYNEMHALAAVDSAISEVSYTLFFKQCIADGLLNKDDEPYMYARGKRSAKLVFLKSLLHSLCDIEVEPDLDQQPRNAALQQDTLYFKIKDNQFYYRIFQKPKSDHSFDDANRDNEDDAIQFPSSQGSIKLSDLFGADISANDSNELFVNLFKNWSSLLSVLRERKHIQKMNVDLLAINWRDLEALYDKILDATTKPVSFYQRHAYIKFTRKTTGSDTSGTFVFQIPQALIEQHLKQCGFDIATSCLSMLAFDDRNTLSKQSVCNMYPKMFSFSRMNKQESRHGFLFKFLLILAAAGLGALALAYLQTSIALTLSCVVGSAVCALQAYSIFTHRDLNQSAISLNQLAQDLGLHKHDSEEENSLSLVNSSTTP